MDAFNSVSDKRRIPVDLQADYDQAQSDFRQAGLPTKEERKKKAAAP
jgi:hypothetical protein